ncbi:hypothetical protein E9228_000544 [Curtobacterium flaccumfaciens]|uniref:Flagellar protein FliT n=1 Tax=Curtobacterium salicis TaxID=1779862 RepID=A0ABX0T360_9MICO|nr:hypothetical protein [Curtobacterium sp. WW7]NII39925.1 hypothetical protein [Curtobacterium sp. WW7]
MSPESETRTSVDLAAARVRWEAVLADLEATLDSSATATDTTVTWTEPTGLGPVPRDLVGRASRLLAAQRDRITALEDARRVTLEHLGALRAVDATRTPQTAVYLDASA